MSTRLEQPNSKLVPYFVLHLLATVPNLALFYTFVSGKVKRDATISQMLFFFPVAALGTSLMLLSGTLKTMPPDRVSNVCVVNAALTISCVPALGFAAFFVVVRILFRVVAAQGRFARFSDSRALTVSLLVIPWAVLVGLFTAGLVGFRDRSKVHVAIFYCAFDDDLLVTFNTLLSLVTDVFIVLFEIVTATILGRHYLSIRKHNVQTATTIATSGQRAPKRKSLTIGGVSLGLALRLFGFGFCVLLALISSVITQGDFASVVGDFVVVSLGPLAFLIFASQADVLRCWHILPPRRPYHSSGGAGETSNPNYALHELRSTPAPERDSILDDGGEERWGSQVALRKKGEDEDEEKYATKTTTTTDGTKKVVVGANKSMEEVADSRW